jgi:2-polyprenyl-3-methyl-5-hydroxy-6-metoxy-1,4-benzoquinol methylase
MMAKYHKYVFDSKKRKLVGKFEAMYKSEDRRNYDSWFQEDLTGLKYVLSRAVLDQYNFGTILDIGCGKGAFTHLLKKKNNTVLGLDVSRTAVKKAKAKYPDIEFKALKAEDILSLRKEFDLAVIMEVLSYLKNWKQVIRKIAKISDYVFISLYIPPNPIGFVKSFQDLSREVEKHFTIVTKIIDETGGDIMIFGKKSNR